MYGSIGRSGFQTYVEMRIEGNDKLYAEGAAKVVWMNTQNGKSVPVPDHIRAALEASEPTAHRIHESTAHGQTQNLGKTAFRRAPRCGQAPGSAERTAFQQDYDRIVFTSAFRRMKDKTQVFPLSKSDYVRTPPDAQPGSELRRPLAGRGGRPRDHRPA